MQRLFIEKRNPMQYKNAKELLQIPRIQLEVGTGIANAAQLISLQGQENQQDNDFLKGISDIEDQIATEMGVIVPDISVLVNDNLIDCCVLI